MSMRLLHLGVDFISLEDMRLLFFPQFTHRTIDEALKYPTIELLERCGALPLCHSATQPTNCQLRVASWHHLAFTKRTFQFRFNTLSGVNGLFKYFDKQFSCTEVW